MEVHGRNKEEIYKRSSRYRSRSNSDASNYSDISSYDYERERNGDNRNHTRDSLGSTSSSSVYERGESFHTSGDLDDDLLDFQFRDIDMRV